MDYECGWCGRSWKPSWQTIRNCKRVNRTPCCSPECGSTLAYWNKNGWTDKNVMSLIEATC